MEEKINNDLENPRQLVLGYAEDVEEMSNTFKNFSGELREHIAELKKTADETFCLKDEKQGIILELQSKLFNCEQLKDMGLKSFKEVLDLRGTTPKGYVG